MIFNVNFDKWILSVLPSFLRRRVVFGLLRAMCAPIKTLYANFLSARESHLYSITHNGQVCYLRAALNDAFKTTGFDIIDYDDQRGEWRYAKPDGANGQLLAKEEGTDAPDDPEAPTVPILYDEIRLNMPVNYFIVLVPGSIYTTRLDKVKIVVDKYRIPSKQPIYTPC